jgi:hypothetical protein
MEESGSDASTGYRTMADLDVLRASGQYRVLTPDAMVAELEAKQPFGFAMLHPLIGGMPPDLGWTMLRLFETDVLPRVSKE